MDSCRIGKKKPPGEHVNGMSTSDAFVGGNSGTSSTGNEVIEVVSIIYIRQ